MPVRSVSRRVRSAFHGLAALAAVSPAAVAQMESSQVETVVVTGTRIPRPEIDLPNPVATLGSDEIEHSGTTNLTDFLKTHASGLAGTSQDGSGSKYRFTVSVGHNFDNDKANITATYEVSYQDHLFFTRRKFTNVGGYTAFVANPNDPTDDPTVPDFILTRDAQFLFSAPTGAIETDGPDFLDGVPDYLGNGQVFNLGTSVGGGSAIGSSGMPYAIDLKGDFQPTERRHIAQLNGRYGFSRYFKLTGEFKYAGVDTQSLSTAPFDDFTLISSDNPFLPSDVAALIAAGGGFGILSEDYLQLRNQENDKRSTYRGPLPASSPGRSAVSPLSRSTSRRSSRRAKTSRPPTTRTPRNGSARTTAVSTSRSSETTWIR